MRDISFPGWLGPIIGPIGGGYIGLRVSRSSELPTVTLLMSGAALGLVAGVIVVFMDRGKK